MSDTDQKAADRRQAANGDLDERVEYGHHGKTPAAWTGSAIAAVGAIVAAVGFVLPGINWWVIGAGLALMLVAPIVGAILRSMGYGQRI
ncbi:HGxxPAAW family protein [Propioniciclava soli]|uniref:DUF3040 domain-containing protein n=1 Tax=Propioniciclava soli TaxID=2775081 RepID=A0ABZ3C2H3_9ACTN|nr:HGxxPAAW family protein [Propioniciclava soli]